MFGCCFSRNMCLLTSSSQDHQVMSSGDSSIVVPPSSIPNSDTTPSNQIELNEQENTSSSHLHLDTSDKINLADSISALDIQEQSMAPSHSNTSLENTAAEQREVTSLEGDAMSLDEETGEMIQRGDAGFFAILGVRRMDAEDLDKSRHAVVSTDSVQIAMEKGESGGSEDSTTASNDKHQPPNNPEASTVKGKFTIVNVLEVMNAGIGITMSPKTMLIGDEAAKSSSVSASGGMAAAATNGSSIQPNRFRRVNQYERGRWTVRDSLVTEEQADNLPLSAKDQESSISAGDTPQQRSDSGPALASYLQALTELGLPGVLSVLGGSGVDSVSDKDSSSIPMDRSSTAAETISRNTSMSSIIATEKSVDGDEILHGDTDSESVAGGTSNQNYTSHEHEEVSLVSPQPPHIPTSSSGAVPPPSSTVLPREDQQPTPAASAPALE